MNHISGRVRWSDTWKTSVWPKMGQEPLLTWRCWSTFWIYFPLYFDEPPLRAGRWVWLQGAAALSHPCSFLRTPWFARAHLPLGAWSAGIWRCSTKGWRDMLSLRHPQAERQAPSAKTELAEGSCWGVVVQGAFHNIFKNVFASSCKCSNIFKVSVVPSCFSPCFKRK